MKAQISTHLRLQHACPDWAAGGASRGLSLWQLQRLAQNSDSHLIELLRQAAHWRWQTLPWDLQGIALFQRTAGADLPAWLQIPPLSEPCVQTLQAIAGQDRAQVSRLWESHGKKEENLVWFGETALFSLQSGDLDFTDRLIETTALPSNHPLLLHSRALQAFCFESADKALPAILNLPDDFSWLRTYLHGSLLAGVGEQAGTKILTALWREIPWHVNLTLKLHDLLAAPTASTPPDRNTAILLYSWNNADLLTDTLHSLARSELGEAAVFILDNGSTDHTPEVIAAAHPFFSRPPEVIRLPVNIGAPGARNWLLQHPHILPYRHIAFVDDDVLLPSDWLSRLLATQAQHPQSAAVGCRIMDRKPQDTVQMAEVNLLEFEAGGDFEIANAGSGELDLGLHHYTRPCLSVTGCCHLLDRERMAGPGGFDLRFSPSQFDDFDLDLRNFLHSGHAVYAGQCAVRHFQRSSLSQADTEAKQGHVLGNLVKLNCKYDAPQKKRLLLENRRLLWDDLLAKASELEQA